MSTSENWDVNRCTMRCTSPVFVVLQCKLVSGWGLKKRRSAQSYGHYGSGRTLLFFRYISQWLWLAAGCWWLDVCVSAWQVDYRGYEVTVENFIRVLTGRLPPSTPRSKRLLSDNRSNILIYMTGHGGDGFLKFQVGCVVGKNPRFLVIRMSTAR